MESDSLEFWVHLAITMTRGGADNLEQLEGSSRWELEPRPSLSPHTALLCESGCTRMHMTEEKLSVQPSQNVRETMLAAKGRHSDYLP